MCNFIVKLILVLSNFVFVISGLIAVGVGVFLMLYIDDWFTDEIPFDLSTFSVLPTILIVIGSVIFLVSFSGCCGALIESKCLVITYVSSLVILVALNIYVATTILTQLDHYQSVAETYVENIFTNPNFNLTFHALETKFKCCGTTGPDSYDGIYEWLPPTCCEGRFDTCRIELTQENCLCEKEDAFKDGCTSTLGQFVAQIGKSVGYGFVLVIVVGVLAFVLAIYLVRSINFKSREKRGRIM